MRKVLAALAVLAVFGAAPLAAQASNMSFFITSAGPGDGANLGGLDGADAHCQQLATAVGAGDLEWRAYLSAVSVAGSVGRGGGRGGGARSAAAQVAGGIVNARDRIGEGPWHNHAGDLIARSVEELHSDAANLTKASILTERGEMVNGRGDDPNMHDILTGSDLDGMASSEEGHDACGNWTSNGEDGSARVGHHDRQGGGQNPTSWNSAHGSRGCSQENLQATGGNGFFYCFAASAGRPQEQPFEE